MCYRQKRWETERRGERRGLRTVSEQILCEPVEGIRGGQRQHFPQSLSSIQGHLSVVILLKLVLLYVWSVAEILLWPFLVSDITPLFKKTKQKKNFTLSGKEEKHWVLYQLWPQSGCFLSVFCNLCWMLTKWMIDCLKNVSPLLWTQMGSGLCWSWLSLDPLVAVSALTWLLLKPVKQNKVWLRRRNCSLQQQRPDNRRKATITWKSENTNVTTSGGGAQGSEPQRLEKQR